MGLLVIASLEFLHLQEPEGGPDQHNEFQHSNEAEGSSEGKTDEENSEGSAALGIIFILASIVVGALRHILQEPPGLEGVVGVIVSSLVCAAVGNAAGFDPAKTISTILDSWVGTCLTLALVPAFLQHCTQSWQRA